MPQKSTNTTEEQSIQEQQKAKSSKRLTALLIGVLIGVFIYSAVKNGFTFFTFFPLILAYLAFWAGKKKSAEQKEE